MTLSRAIAQPVELSSAQPDDRRHRTHVAFALAALVAAVGGAVVLFANLATGTVGVDEPLYVRAGWEYVNGDAGANLEHPYLAKQLIGVSQLVFGQTLLGARVVGSLLAAVTTLLVFDVGRRVAGRWTGLTAAGVFLLLPQAPGSNVIRLDRVATLESTMTFFIALSLLLAVVAVQRASPGMLVAAGAAAGLATSAKLPGAVAVVPVALAVLAVHAGHRRVTWLGLTALATSFAFWLPYAAQGDARLDGLRYALAFQAEHVADGHAQLVAGTVHLRAPWWSHWWWQQDYLGLVATAVLWAVALLGVVVWARRAALVDRTGYLLVVALLVASVAFLLLSPLRLPHYHLLWSVALSVVAGAGLSWAATRSRLLLSLLAAPLVLAAALNVERAATLDAADYARLPVELAEAGVETGPVLLWGYSQIAQQYLPSALPLTNDPALAAAIVIDPVVADRQQGTDVDRALDRVVQTCDRAPDVDRLRLYLCPG